MAQWVPKANGNVVPRRTVHLLNVYDLSSPQEVKKQETVDALIERIWGTSAFPPPASTLKLDNNK